MTIKRLEDELDLIDLLKARPQVAVQAWAKKMKREGGEHPFAWCVQKAAKFSGNPEAFCAAVHLEAYGKTPSERKADKKG